MTNAKDRPARIPSWRSDRRTAAERGYGSRWRKAREAFLRDHPLCQYCQEDGKVELATVVNHIIPHKGDQDLFWDRANWQAVCKPHHDSTIAREESRGMRVGRDQTGQPLDPGSHWYR